MTARRSGFFLAAGFFIFAAAGPAGAVQVERMYGVLSGGRALEVTAGEALVKFAPSVSAADKAAALGGIGAKVIYELTPIGWTVVGLPPGTSVAAALPALKSLPGVQSADPNRVYRALATPSDPLVSAQWHLANIGAYSAWDIETGGSNPVTIAVMDSGIQGNHPDLQAKLTGTSQFFNPDSNPAGQQSANNPPTAACGHATQVAGAAAAVANNGIDGVGVSWGSTLISLKVFHDNDCKNSTDCNSALNPNCGTNDGAIAGAANYAAGLPAALGHPVVLNMSIGGAGSCSAAVQAALTNAYNAGVVLVAAAGNDGGAVNSPGNCSGVIPVAATDSNDNVASFSSHGPELAAYGLAAPGVAIVTTDMNSSTIAVSGTSFSAPIAAGAAALVLSRRPAFSPANVQALLRNSADSVTASALGLKEFRTLDNSQGAGRLNANSAVILAKRGLTAFPTDDNTPAIFPNPFRPSVTAATTVVVPAGLKATLQSIKIYTVDGRLVRTLRGQTWDGKNDSGNPVATGTYVVLVTASGGTASGKISLIR